MISAFLAAVLATTLPAGTLLSVDPGASFLRYHVTHKLHRVQGASTTIEGKAVVRDGQVVSMVRVPVASFRSGDANRDSHMQETLEAHKYPFIVWKGVAQLLADNALPAGPVTMQGQLEFHGVARAVSVPLTVEPGADGTVRVRGSLEIDLDAHRIDRPSLLFVKIDDMCRIELDLVLKAAKS